MRTTPQVDDDVLTSVRYLARQDAKPVGRMMSEWVRCALKASALGSTQTKDAEPSSLLRRKLANPRLIPFTSPNGTPMPTAMVDALDPMKSDRST